MKQFGLIVAAAVLALANVAFAAPSTGSAVCEAGQGKAVCCKAGVANHCTYVSCCEVGNAGFHSAASCGTCAHNHSVAMAKAMSAGCAKCGATAATAALTCETGNAGFFSASKCTTVAKTAGCAACASHEHACAACEAKAHACASCAPKMTGCAACAKAKK